MPERSTMEFLKKFCGETETFRRDGVGPFVRHHRIQSFLYTPRGNLAKSNGRQPIHSSSQVFYAVKIIMVPDLSENFLIMCDKAGVFIYGR
jgi:hypothetical protein